MKSPIYLDYNATSPLLPQVRERMEAVAALPLNPSSVHSYGRMAKKLLEDSRKILADYLSVWPDEVLFTASATEANNTALQAFPQLTLAVAATEHSSILSAAKERPDSIILPVDENGLLKLDALESTLQQYGANLLVSVMLANNETGVIQPIAEIAKRVKAAGALMHCDAVQGFGKLPLDFNLLGVDMLTLAAHKVGGPVGVGVLVIRSGLTIHPLLIGGGQEKRRRAGTENIPAIVGMAKLVSNLPSLHPLQEWRHKIETQIFSFSSETKIFGAAVDRIPNTICLTMPHISSETQLMNFDLAGICVSAGSACSSGRIESSHVLKAMGVSEAEASTAIRISMGWGTTETEINQFIEEWRKLWEKLRHKAAA